MSLMCGIQAQRTEVAEDIVDAISHHKLYFAIKRIFDVAFSSVVIVALAPLCAAIACAIKIDDPEGPVFYVQKRVGQGGREFRMYKFRSMVANADELLEGLQDLNEKEYPLFKIADDPRVTRMGKLLRKTSIDELPQFLNVLLGDMSVVGPRPPLPVEVAVYTPRQRQRLLVRPGITCTWQTRIERDDIGLDDWVELDLQYIRNCSLKTDLYLIARTVGVVLSAQGS